MYRCELVETYDRVSVIFLDIFCLAMKTMVKMYNMYGKQILLHRKVRNKDAYKLMEAKMQCNANTINRLYVSYALLCG